MCQALCSTTHRNKTKPCSQELSVWPETLMRKQTTRTGLTRDASAPPRPAASPQTGHAPMDKVSQQRRDRALHPLWSMPAREGACGWVDKDTETQTAKHSLTRRLPAPPCVRLGNRPPMTSPSKASQASPSSQYHHSYSKEVRSNV